MILSTPSNIVRHIIIEPCASFSLTRSKRKLGSHIKSRNARAKPSTAEITPITVIILGPKWSLIHLSNFDSASSSVSSEVFSADSMRSL